VKDSAFPLKPGRVTVEILNGKLVVYMGEEANGED